MLNVARNHHFVSQVEQRLNAINPNASKKTQRIFSFSVKNREDYKIELENENGLKIEKNLSFDDLYSFDVLDERQRLNLEDAFREYEQRAGELTISLLQKVQSESCDIKDEIINIFALKLLNTFRNPHCIEKTLNTIGNLSNYSPANEELKSLYEKIDNGTQPSKEAISTKYSVSVEQYVQWMKALFMLLVPRGDQDLNLLDLIVKDFFENTGSYIKVSIHSYSESAEGECVLLSDRGFSILTEDPAHTAYEFNLSSHAFVTYIFTDISKLSRENYSEELINSMLSFQSQQVSDVKVSFVSGDLEALSRYNKNVVYQAFDTIFCKSKQVYGLRQPG